MLSVYEIAKIFSSENKSKIIAHFYGCKCIEKDCVADIEHALNINQSNLSKNIGMLLKLDVLTYKQVHKHRYYQLNSKFVSEYKDFIELFVNSKENIKYICEGKHYGK